MTDFTDEIKNTESNIPEADGTSVQTAEDLPAADAVLTAEETVSEQAENAAAEEETPDPAAVRREKREARKVLLLSSGDPVKKNILTDILLILLAFILAAALRIPGFSVPGETEEEKERLRTEEGVPYLFDMDSYFYADRARTYASGEAGGLVEMRTDNPHQNTISTTDDEEIMGGLPALFAVLWKTAGIFSDVSLEKFLVYAGPLVASLSCVPAYIFIRRRWGRAGAFTGALCAAMAPSFISHTSYACFDTDILLFVLPLTVFCAYAEAAEEKNIKKQLIWAAVSALFFAYLTVTWTSYSVYYFLGIGLFIGLSFFALLLSRFSFKKAFARPEVRGSGICAVLFTAVTFITRGRIDTSAIDSVIAVFTGSTTFSAGEYPSQGKYVSELKNMSFFPSSWKNILDVGTSSVITRIGGPILALVCLLTFFTFARVIILNLKKNGRSWDCYPSVMLFIMWSLAGFAAVFAGTRFVQIPAIPLSIAAGLGIGFYERHTPKKDKFLPALLAGAMVLPLCVGCWNISDSANPSADDSLYETCRWIDENTDEDAVICSWWDLGYFYEYEANRRAVADGSVFNGRSFYWFANALFTEDPLLCRNIFTMLEHSGTDASILADELTGSSAEGSQLVKDILVMEKKDAAELLKDLYGIEGEDAEKLLALTHPESSPELIISITSDMNRKVGAIGYYATWNFDGEPEKVSAIPPKSMLYKLYNHTVDASGNFEFLYENEDPNDNKYSSRIWRVVK